jgi:hypothetical protein
MWEYLIHSNNKDKLASQIIKSGYLDIYDTTHSHPDSEPGIFMNLLFNTLEYEGKYWHYRAYTHKSPYVIFGFDTNILNEYPFKICSNQGHALCKGDEILMEGNKKQSLSGVKKHINQSLKHSVYKTNDPFYFTETHEVMIRKRLPLEKCKFIMIQKSNKLKEKIKEKYPHIKLIYITLKTENYKELLETI